VQKAYTIVLILLCQLIGNKLFAQSNSIVGEVRDHLGQPVAAVNVRLISNVDTLVCRTDERGEYKLRAVKGRFVTLTYSMLGYKTESSAHYFIENEITFKLPIVTLKSISNIIPSVDVVHVVPMVISGDTTQFNFGAYDFRKNALLEEALKELPGVQVYRDGSVTFNGRLIRKVRVDNKDFFGGDLLTATRNLPADFIKNIQFINASAFKDESTGIIREDEEKVLNITLKEDKKKILFGQTTLGKGTNDRYIGSFGLNNFNSGQEISVLGSFNNTNTSLFTYGNPIGGDRSKNIMDIEGFSDPIDGLNKVGSVGINVSDQLSKTIYFNASYNYLYQNNFTVGNSILSSTYTNNTINRKDDYSINTEDRNHKVRFGFDMKFKNNDIFKINGNFTFNHQYITQFKDLLLTNSKIKSSGNYQDSSRRNNPNGDLDLLYSKFFAKKGRKLFGNLIINSNNQNRYEFVNERYLETSLSQTNWYEKESFQDQLIKQKNHTNAAKATFTYVEPFSEYSLFEFAYEYEVTTINSLRLVEDRLAMGDYKYIDSLGVDYDYLFSSHKGSMTYQYEPNKKFKMNVGFAVQPLLLEGYLRRDDVYYTYDNVNLIPSANLIYKFSKEMDWQLSYKGKNNQPYFNQIAPVIDNTNSKSVIIGNPELKAEYAHRVATTFRKTSGSKNQYFETNLAYNYIFNKIVSDKRTLPASNVQETTFKNTSGYYDLRWYYTFSTPFITDDFQLDLTGTTDYFNNLSYIDSRKRITKQIMFNQAVHVRYSWNDYFESSLHANYVLNKARYDIPYKTKINIATMFIGIGAKSYISDNLALGFEMSQRFNDGYKNTIFNANQTLMNSFIEATFLKNKSISLRLQANDLFDQNKNSGIISEYIGNDVYEARNNRLGRYFMMSLNVRLQKLPKKN